MPGTLFIDGDVFGDMCQKSVLLCLHHGELSQGAGWCRALAGWLACWVWLMVYGIWYRDDVVCCPAILAAVSQNVFSLW